jgi:hypothetical protein
LEKTPKIVRFPKRFADVRVQKPTEFTPTGLSRRLRRSQTGAPSDAWKQKYQRF